MTKYKLNQALFGLEKGTEIVNGRYEIKDPSGHMTIGYMDFSAVDIYLLLKDGAISEMVEEESVPPATYCAFHGKDEVCPRCIKKEEKPERWKPERMGAYYYIDSFGQIHQCIYYPDTISHLRIEMGNCFPTEKAAEAKLPDFLAVFKR